MQLFRVFLIEGGTAMHKVGYGAAGALALIAWALPVHSQAADSALELALMPRTMTVTLLNEGGKYVLIELRHITQGETCRMDKDAAIMLVGPGASPETTRVRHAAPQISSGGCPFMTVFDLTNIDYADGRAALLKMGDEASRKVEDVRKDLGERAEEVKKELGEKWEEIFGKKD
jgi:hypothetical protein